MVQRGSGKLRSTSGKSQIFWACFGARCAESEAFSINYGQAEIGFPDIRLAYAMGDFNDSL